MTKAHKTAMKRNAPSRPMLRLSTDGRIVGRALDYGSGRGFDADTYDMEKYDPHFQPVMPTGSFVTIVSNYVLNVIESDIEKARVLTDIRGRLLNSGRSFITVRNDRRALRGKTSKGTYQCHVVLKLPVVYSCAGFVTYELKASDRTDTSILESRTYEN